jgi:Uma2 family endonuclease
MSTGVRVTIEEYDRMLSAGAFDPAEDHQVELIRGEIREMSPINPPHENVLERLMYWSVDHAPRKEVRVRLQHSLGLPEIECVPQPDLAWVRQRDYSRQRPTAADVILIVEVADTSLGFDRGEKADMYAEAGIGEYWVVNVNGRSVDVHREPHMGKYREVRTFTPSEFVAPRAYPQIRLSIAELFLSDVP